MPVKPKRRNTPHVSHNTIIVLNPVLGGSRYARPEAAEKWVKGGLARWADVLHTRLLLSPVQRVALAGFRYREVRDCAINYDCILQTHSSDRLPLTVKELAAIPIANPKKLMRLKRPPRKSPKGTAWNA